MFSQRFLQDIKVLQNKNCAYIENLESYWSSSDTRLFIRGSSLVNFNLRSPRCKCQVYFFSWWACLWQYWRHIRRWEWEELETSSCGQFWILLVNFLMQPDELSLVPLLKIAWTEQSCWSSGAPHYNHQTQDWALLRMAGTDKLW